MQFQDVVNRICGHLPEGYQLDLRMENGAAWFELTDVNGDKVELPDSGDKTLETQINEAANIANGFEL